MARTRESRGDPTGVMLEIGGGREKASELVMWTQRGESEDHPVGALPLSTHGLSQPFKTESVAEETREGLPHCEC